MLQRSISKKRKVTSPSTVSAPTSTVLSKLQSILQAKAPEVIPLLEALFQLLAPSPREVVEADKRSRSIDISGITEGDLSSALSERASFTSNSVSDILDTLAIDVRSAEVYRFGGPNDGGSRLVKCVFPSRPSFDVPKRSKMLRSVPRFKDVYVRRSMTVEERRKDKEYEPKHAS